MPELNSPMHLKMLNDAQRYGDIERDGLYGLTWGDPQKNPALRAVRDHFVLPYVHPDRTAIEIGPGGGRWTRYLLGFGRLYAVDYHQLLLDELGRSFRAPCLQMVRNAGADFPGIDDSSVDYAFSFGCFVHLDLPVIEGYLRELHRVLRSNGGCAVIQYADKTKEEGRKLGAVFTDTTPEIMLAMVTRAGHRVLEDDRETMWHSSIVRFGPVT